MNWLGENSLDLFYLASRESSLIDPEYRYKISKPIIYIIGKKGNKTTLFENSEYYSEKIGVQSIFFGKYIGNRISCPSSIDKEKNCISWKGEYTKDQIEKYLKDFIKIYILCSKCDYPETDMYLTDKKLIGLLCRSCGKSNLIESKYMDKTYDYIQKNIK
jgi:translation initiation factor 2 beta subunit (eIF-2beta)/eIF-5